MADSIVVELAGVPLEVVCRARENLELLRGYETDKAPLERVEPTDRDLEATSAILHFVRERNGGSSRELTDRYVENFELETQIVMTLAPYGILQLHASALCIDGEGYAFAAPSGTGKSTHSRLWREAFGDRVVMINDDAPLIRIEEDAVFICGSPWNGKHGIGTNASAPLKAIIALERGVENRIEKISAAEAFPVVFKQARASANRSALIKIMDLERRLLEKVKCFRLRCNMSSDAPLVAWRGLTR